MAAGGDLGDQQAVLDALHKAEFDSVRGAFKFGPNNHPIQDIYVRQVVQEGDVLTNKILGVALSEHSDAYAKDCKL
jgi:branched-chain amino acid transport system substrate-binding protein